MTESLLRRGIRTALYGSAALAVVLPAAHAQDQDDAEQLETITVVGSRIKRTDIETSQPVFILEREDLAKTGLASVGDILQDLSTSGATLNTTFNNGGNGATFSDLRNLGCNQVLVLVNGRRWATTFSGLVECVDLNTIPVSAIERIEVLKDGASAIYGSDANAGVINITLRDSYDGAEATAYLQENEEGDGRTEQYSFTVGSSTDRASVLMSATYLKQEPIFAGDREISAVPLFGFPSNTGFPGQASGSTPFGQFVVPGRTGTQTLIPGRPGSSPSDFRPYSFATDAYNFAPDNYLQTPSERTGLYVQARYNVTDTIRFTATALYNERRSSQELAPTPLVVGTGGGLAGTITIPATNVFNPFGVTVPIALFRNKTQARNFAQDFDTWYFSGSFDGNFDAFDRSFSWDVNYFYTDNERRDTTEGLLNLQNVRSGLGPSFRDANGVARCGTPTAVIAGCVPLNLFGGPDGFTQAMYNYASFTAQEYRYKETIDYTANITGDLFELPAGPLSFAAGYEYRREFGFDLPDAFISAGISSGNARLPTRGRYSLDEFYGEFNIPVLKDLAFAEIFEIAIAARYSDYSNFGDTTNPRIGFRYKPFADLLIRGNYADGFRAPSIPELFAGNGDSFQQIADPCSLQSNPVGDVLSRCRNGFGGVGPTPVGYNQLNAQIRVTQGGNANLTPELSTSRTLGLVYSPSWIEGLDIFLDWYNISIIDQIAPTAGQVTLNNCYRLGQSASCAFITRSASGEVIDLFAGNQNQPGGLEVEGYDFNVEYRFDTDVGRFRINWSNAYTSYFGAVDQPDGGNTVGLFFSNARVPAWRLRSVPSIDWSKGDWGATLTARYYSSVDEDCTAAENAAIGLTNVGIATVNPCSNPAGTPQFPVAENSSGSATYIDLQGRWATPWNGQVAAGVRNLFDEDPPLLYSAFANTFSEQYDIPGRFWYVQYTQKF